MWSGIMTLVAVLLFLGGLVQMLSSIASQATGATGAVLIVGSLLLVTLCNIADSIGAIHADLKLLLPPTAPSPRPTEPDGPQSPSARKRAAGRD